MIVQKKVSLPEWPIEPLRSIENTTPHRMNDMCLRSHVHLSSYSNRIILMVIFLNSVCNWKFCWQTWELTIGRKPLCQERDNLHVILAPIDKTRRQWRRFFTLGHCRHIWVLTGTWNPKVIEPGADNLNECFSATIHSSLKLPQSSIKSRHIIIDICFERLPV